MILTTKGRYAITAMLDLATTKPGIPTTLEIISERQNISLSYLEQLFSKLRRASLVRSVRGPGGGYQLKLETDDISIADIIDAVNESIDTTRCKEKAGCQDGEKCLTHHLWSDLSKQIHSFLSNITLATLMSKREVQVTSARQNTASELIASQLLDS